MCEHGDEADETQKCAKNAEQKQIIVYLDRASERPTERTIVLRLIRILFYFISLFRARQPRNGHTIVLN